MTIKGRKKRKKPRSQPHVDCHICPNKPNKRVAHEHHIVPRAAQGGNEKTNLVWLCNGCHATIHVIATSIMGGRTGEVANLLTYQFPTPKYRERAAELARIVAIELTQQKERGGPEIHKLTIGIPHSRWTALRALAADRGYKSVRGLVKAMIKGEVKKSGLQIDRPIKENAAHQIKTL